MAAAATAFLFWFLGQELGWWAEFLVGDVAVVVWSVLLRRATCVLVGRPVARRWLIA